MRTLEHLSEEFKHFEDRLRRIEKKKLVVDLSQLNRLGSIEPFLRLAEEDKLHDKLFQIFLNQIMPHVYRLIKVPTIGTVSKLNIESNTLHKISYQLNTLFNKLNSCNIYDFIGMNSTLAKNINMDESDEWDNCQFQLPNNSEYWDQLLKVTPKIDQNIQKMSKNSSSRLSIWIEENDIICPALKI